jgi:hypothetical protein
MSKIILQLLLINFFTDEFDLGKVVGKDVVAFEFGFVGGHDGFIEGGVFGIEAEVQDICDVEFLVIKEYG